MPIKCVFLLISSNTWVSWVNAQHCCILLSQEKVTVEQGTARSYAFSTFTASHAFLEELNFITLHYLLKVISL